MKKIKIDFSNLKPGPSLSYVFLTLITSLLIVVLLISLPLTESLTSSVSYNLTNKNNSYWEKEYTLVLDTSSVLDTNKNSYIQQTRDVLYRRLNKGGVEESSVIYEEDSDGQDILKINVKTSKDEAFVDNLVENRYYVQIVTRKDDVDFDDESNPYAYLFATNYDATDFTGSSFRHVLVTKLKNSSGEYSYFAVFKTYLLTNSKFQKFLTNYEGKYIGVNIDGYVTPYYVGTSDTKVFAISVYGGESQSQLIDILYNSGEIPLAFEATAGTVNYIQGSSFNYIYLSIGLITATAVMYACLLYVLKENKKTTTLALFSTILSISGWISYLKISSTPIDLWMLAIECIFIAVLVYVLANNRDSQILITVSLALISFMLIFYGLGYMRIFGTQMIFVLLISQFSIAFGKWYLDNIKNTLRR